MAIRLGAFVVAVAPLLAACGAGGGAIKADSSGEKEVKVGVLKIAALTDPWVAQEEGFFKKNGLKVDFVEFGTGSAAIAAMQGGDIDITLSIPGTAMTAVENGVGITAIFQNELAHAKGPDSGAIVVPTHSSATSLSDLKGANFAVAGAKGQKTTDDLALLKKAGVSKDDVKITEIPYTNMADALRTGQVQAASPVDPFTTQIIKSGVGRVISWDYCDSIPNQPVGAWYAKKDWVSNNGSVVKAFDDSLVQAIDYLNADPSRAREKVAAFTGLDPKMVATMLPVRWSYDVNVADWQAVSDEMTASGDLRKKHSADEFLSSYIKKYEKP